MLERCLLLGSLSLGGAAGQPWKAQAGGEAPGQHRDQGKTSAIVEGFHAHGSFLNGNGGDDISAIVGILRTGSYEERFRGSGFGFGTIC